MPSQHYLTLVRHAKSSWKDDQLADIDRPLNKRGRGDLPGLSARLTQKITPPDLILLSPARRTRATAEPLCAAWPQVEVRLTPEIYEASLAQLLALVVPQLAVTRHLMLIGHNPGLAELAQWMTGHPVDYFPTAAWIQLGWPAEQPLLSGCAQRLLFDYPKLHRSSL
ncbi:histidine phosphatase family protein [Marinospirillum sp. MEB164]|uniref:Histidine phosphatase family protein n=1 Tax=Marinospirillum alkalitolerans TaxID=3123374 RepID=A0ABW8PUL9_9GAMM